MLRIDAPLAKWRHEGGGHRFQRVPPTERRGRVHTSTVTVAVFPSEKPKAAFDQSDVRIEWFSGTGKGGQHRNKHQNSCRAFHGPTGLSAKAECRSRQNSEAEARAELERRVLADLGAGLDLTQAEERKGQVGTGMRGDKVRTYRLQDDQVTDHRTDQRTTWRAVQRGDFERLGT